MIKEDSNAVRAVERKFRSTLAEYETKSGLEAHTDKQLNALAAIGTADYLSAQFVFGEDKKTAEESTQAFVREAMQCFKSAAQIDKVAYGYELVMGWLAANNQQFDEDTAGKEVYGMRETEGDKKLVYVIKATLDDFLYRQGLNPTQMATGWKERGLLTKTDDKHTTVKKVVGGNRVRCYVFELDQGLDFEPIPPGEDADMPPEWQQGSLVF